MKKTVIKSNKEKTGFTLLIAMIVTALILAIGFSIGSIILKELSLSASGKRSQVAFYAADSIAECARYWDKKDKYGYSVEGSDLVADSPFAPNAPLDPYIKCGTGIDPTNNPGGVQDFTIVYGDVNGDNSVPANNVYATSSFVAVFTIPGDPASTACGEVTIIKTPPFNTTIEARGYNVGYTPGDGVIPPGCDISNPKTVERGLKIQY